VAAWAAGSDEAAYLAWEARRGDGVVAFARDCIRQARLKRRLDCGHWIDGSELYRYYVAKIYGDEGLYQRTDCEPCARVDRRY